CYLVRSMGYKTPCWVWQMGRTAKGYSTIKRGGRLLVGHAFFYRAYVGAIPDNLLLDHLCRVPLCVNPAHLEAVTPAVNSQRGNSAKLTTELVHQLMWLRAQGYDQGTVADRFGVSPSLVCRIERGYSRWLS